MPFRIIAPKGSQSAWERQLSHQVTSIENGSTLDFSRDLVPKTFKCLVCSKSFARQMHLKYELNDWSIDIIHADNISRHSKKHDLPYRCHLCDYKSALQSDLNRHKKARHQDHKIVFRCRWPGCMWPGKYSKVALRKDFLLRHMNSAHKCWQRDASADDHTARQLEIQRIYSLSTREVDSAMKSYQSAFDLVEAAAKGDLSNLQSLLKDGVDVDTRKYSGRTALYWATKGSHEHLVAFLLQYGANIDRPNGLAELCEAFSLGHLGISKRLLDSGASIHSGDSEHLLCPFNAAFLKGYLNIVDLLRHCGVDILKRDPCVHSALCAASLNGHIRIVKLLLELGADPNAEGDVVEEWLLRIGVIKGWRVISNTTPLQVAVMNGHIEVFKVLLNHGAVYNYRPSTKVAHVSSPDGPDGKRGGMGGVSLGCSFGTGNDIPPHSNSPGRHILWKALGVDKVRRPSKEG